MAGEGKAPIIHPTRIDPGDGRTVTGKVVVKCWSDGALSVEYDGGAPEWTLAVLANAADAVRNQINRTRPLIVPPKDVALPGSG